MFSSHNMVTAAICPGLHVQKTIFIPPDPWAGLGPQQCGGPGAGARRSRVFLAVAGAGLKVRLRLR